MTPREQEACESTFSDWFQLHGDVGTWAGYEAGWAAALQWRTPRLSLLTRGQRQVLSALVYAIRWVITSDTKEELAARRRTRLTRRGRLGRS